MNLGGEQKSPKSWGNTYLRVSLMDIIKLVSIALAVSVTIQKLGAKVDTVNAKVNHLMQIKDVEHNDIYRRLQRLEINEDSKKSLNKEAVWTGSQK